MVTGSWAPAMATVFLGLVGLWLAHNYRRQVRVRLAERQVDCYLRLWKLTSVATPERTTPMDAGERRGLYEAMVRWYFDDGDGIFLSPATRNLFVGMRSNLVCPVEALQPPALARELTALDDAEAERRRGCVSIRQASLLRTQLKTDLDLHLGYVYYSDLGNDDRAFLRSCGLPLWRKPWRRRLLRVSGRHGLNPCVCGACRPQWRASSGVPAPT
jgi:hypothetical protein